MFLWEQYGQMCISIDEVVFNVLIFLHFLRHLDYLADDIPTTGGIGMYQNTPADMSSPAEVPMEQIIQGEER